MPKPVGQFDQKFFSSTPAALAVPTLSGRPKPPTKPTTPATLELRSVTSPKPKRPKQVLQKHLYPNNKLLNEDQIKKVQEDLKKEASGYRYPKTRFEKYNINYAILKGKTDLAGNFDCYAVYNDSGFQCEIGEGGQGKIKLAQRLRDGKWFILKTQKNNCYIGDFQKEYEVNVAFGLTPDIAFQRLHKSKENLEKVEFLTQYAEGYDLFELQKKGEINQKTALIIVNAILKVYKQEILTRNYIHCDIKLENFIFNPDTNDAQIIDLAFAEKCWENQIIKKASLQGTTGYLAPESENLNYYSRASDIYAFGILLEELLFNCTQKPGSPRFQFKECYPRIIYNPDVENELRDFLKGMRDDDSTKRPTFDAVFDFFKTFGENNRADSLDEKVLSADQKQPLNPVRPGISPKKVTSPLVDIPLTPAILLPQPSKLIAPTTAPGKQPKVGNGTLFSKSPRPQISYCTEKDAEVRRAAFRMIKGALV